MTPEAISKVLEIIKANILVLLFGLVGIIALLYGSYSMLGNPSQVDSSNDDVQVLSDEDVSEEIYIDVSGAVRKPGVYRLDSESRLQDVINLAGGTTEDADTYYIAKKLNLAQRVQDGVKIYIPFKDEAEAVTEVGAQSVSVNDTQSSMININTATATELDVLPGVGPATAAKIISNRPYESIDDLLVKKAVGNSVFEKIKQSISVY